MGTQITQSQQITQYEIAGIIAYQSLNCTYSLDQVTSLTRGAEEDTLRWDYLYDARR